MVLKYKRQGYPKAYAIKQFLISALVDQISTRYLQSLEPGPLCPLSTKVVPTNFKMFAWRFVWPFVWQNPGCVALCVAKPGLRGDLRDTLCGLTLEGVRLNGYGHNDLPNVSCY